MAKNNGNLDKVLAKLTKKYGKEVVKQGLTIEKKFLPTGILNVDWALGGGFFQGGFIELYGPQSSGKSTLALKVMALAQKDGKTCAYIDVEDAYDSGWAKTNGVNTDDLLLMNRESVNEVMKEKGEKGINAEFILQLMIDLIDTKGVDILVLDSIACLTPKDELNKEMDEEAKMAGVAKILNRALRVMNSKNQRASTIIFINQLRDNVGSYGGGSTTPGGKAVRYYAFQRINVKRAKNVTKKDVVVGYNAIVNVEKSKVSIPHRIAEFIMYNDSSVDRFEVYWNLAQNLNYFGEGTELKGRTYSYNGEIVAKSQEEFKNYLQANNDIFEKLEKSLINVSKTPVVAAKIEVDLLDKTENEIAEEIIKDDKA